MKAAADRSTTNRRSIRIALACWITTLGGCHSPDGSKPKPERESTGLQFVQAEPQFEHAASDPILPQDDNTAETAERLVAAMPGLNDPRAQQEIALHAALSRAAIQASVGSTGRFVLEPAHDSAPPQLGINPAEFRLRVLASLADLHVPIAWAPASWRDQHIDYFPNTQDKATRITITISERDQNQATVAGEVGDQTFQDRCSRQAFTAMWDGVQWHVQRDRTRVVW